MRDGRSKARRVAPSVAACALAFGCACTGPRNDGSREGREAAAGEVRSESHATEPVMRASGLGIIEVSPGAGEPCPPGATVTIRYRAMIADEPGARSGREYDSSERRKRALTFSLGAPGLIPGLREGIEGMRAGGKRVLLIPWKLGYGETGREPVPPEADLVFEVELVEWAAAAIAAD